MEVKDVVAHCELLLESYERLVGRELIAPPDDSSMLPSMLDAAPFALVSHGVEDDPVFNYANQPALKLFGMSWQEFTQLPSRYSAEEPNREERARLLEEVSCKGYIDNYQGMRIAKDGRRFWISGAVVWNVIDRAGKYCGQAAMFSLSDIK